MQCGYFPLFNLDPVLTLILTTPHLNLDPSLPLLTLILTQSSTILVMAFMTLASCVFSISPTRIVPMKPLRMSGLITPTRFFTRSRLRMSSSLATTHTQSTHTDIESGGHHHTHTEYTHTESEKLGCGINTYHHFVNVKTHPSHILTNSQTNCWVGGLTEHKYSLFLVFVAMEMMTVRVEWDQICQDNFHIAIFIYAVSILNIFKIH